MTEINQLSPVTELASDDAIPVQQTADGVTRYATPAQIQAAAGALIGANNLEDLESPQAARNNLGLGAIAVLAAGPGLAIGGGNLAVQFGTTPNTVADGGALAAAQATASAAMPNTTNAMLSLLTLIITTADLPNSAPAGGGWWINGTGTSGVLTYYNGTPT